MNESIRAIGFFFFASFVLTLAFLLACPSAHAQENNIAAFGLGYSQSANPGVMGWGAYGRMTGDTTAIFTDYDLFRVDADNAMLSVAGFRLKYSIRTGVAQQLYKAKAFSLWGLFQGGLAADGVSVVRSLQYGGLVDVPVKKGVGVLTILAAEDNPITGRDFAPRIGLRFKF